MTNQCGSGQPHELRQFGPSDVLGVVEPILAQAHQRNGIGVFGRIVDEYIFRIVELVPWKECRDIAKPQARIIRQLGMLWQGRDDTAVFVQVYPEFMSIRHRPFMQLVRILETLRELGVDVLPISAHRRGLWVWRRP